MWLAVVVDGLELKARGRALLAFLSSLSGRGKRLDPVIGRAVDEAFAEFAKEMAEQ